MNSNIELFIKNSYDMKTAFKWDYRMIQMLSALIYSCEGKMVDTGRIKESKQIIKDNTGLFSNFKGNSSLVIATYLSLKEERESLFKRTVYIYDKLREAGFHGCEYLTIAAFNIANQCNDEECEEIIIKSRSIYEGMKKNHFLLTGSDDYIYATMLAMSNIDSDVLIKSHEEIYGVLKKNFFSGNGVQALSDVLVLSTDDRKALIDRTMDIYNKFRDKGYKLSNSYMLPMIGIMALTGEDVQSIIDRVLEIYEYLKEQKGFGSFSLSKQERLMFAISLEVSDEVKRLNKGVLDSTLATSITNIIIAQQTAMIAASSSAACAAASSSGS